MKTYRKLGFNADETQKVVDSLNNLLANFHVHYQKLRNFHWNVVGPDFFELHAVFEEEYDQVKLQIDEVAERIRVFGKTPYSTLAKYLEISEIKEAETDLSSEKMVKEILHDFEILLTLMVEATEAAEAIGDIATEDLITGYIKRTEKRHWMLTAFIEK
jgi:starvation-inducible DNA-binding protein